ncbi:MAG TPA: histidine triad nucleotide-binding protein [Myxococcota bacterium]|nr:histidine triad nucleotide-binding protein [Myxococcota bacterium]
MAAETCIFCSIIEKKIPAQIIAESERSIAFKDINPMADFHVLIIPKVHFTGLNELTEELGPYVADMALMAKNLAREFGFADNGYRVVINTGSHAGQSVFHLHMHMLAGRDFSWPPG